MSSDSDDNHTHNNNNDNNNDNDNETTTIADDKLYKEQCITQYEEYHNQCMVIQKYITELILFIGIEQWENSQLRYCIITNQFSIGFVLSIVCQRSFVVSHTTSTLVHINDIIVTLEDRTHSVTTTTIGYNDDDTIVPPTTNEQDELFSTSVIIPFELISILLNESCPSSSLSLSSINYDDNDYYYKNPLTGRTILHELVESTKCLIIDDSTIHQQKVSVVQIVIAILEKYPKLVSVSDNDSSTPIDLLSNVLLTKEERYIFLVRAYTDFTTTRSTLIVLSSSDSDNDDEDDNIEKLIQFHKKGIYECWELARILLATQINNTIKNTNQQQHDQQQQQHHDVDHTTTTKTTSTSTSTTIMNLPIIHACLTADNVPMTLIEKSIKQFGRKQLSLLDNNGNTPLHLALLRRIPNTKKNIMMKTTTKKKNQNEFEIDNNDDNDIDNNDDNNDDDDDDEIEIWSKVIHTIICNSFALSVSYSMNNNKQTPLDIALLHSYQRIWDKAIIPSLIAVYPKGLADCIQRNNNIPQLLVPYICQMVLNYKYETIIQPNDTALYKMQLQSIFHIVMENQSS